MLWTIHIFLPKGKGSTRKAMNLSCSSEPVTGGRGKTTYVRFKQVSIKNLKPIFLCYSGSAETVHDRDIVSKIWLHPGNWSKIGIHTSWSRHSNFQTLSPRSFISFHHLKPTKIRPLTFFTTQKSRAARRTVTTKMMTKLSIKRADRM